MHHTRLAALLVAFLVAGGCLEARSTTVLKRDGSGTYAQVVDVDLAKAHGWIEALKKDLASHPAADDGVGDDPFASLDPKARRKALAHARHVRVTDARQEEDAAHKTRTYTLHVAYDDLKSFYESGAVEDVAVALRRTKDGKDWSLTIRHVFDGNDREPEDEQAMKALVKLRRALLERYRTWWGGITIRRTLTLPTPVRKTNGTVAPDGRTVTWTVGFDDLADPRRLRQEVTFADAPDLKLKPFELTANDIANARELSEMEAEKEGGK
jgi:hypothetical protein